MKQLTKIERKLKENSARYVSHKDFLSQCIKSKLVPKGLELTLEPTIGNFDQEFIDKWCYSLKEFSLTLMSHVATFCDKTIKETNDKIDQTDSILKTKLEKAEYKEIQKAIASSETPTEKIQHQQKFEKYNNLKYKPKPAVIATNITDENENLKKAAYAEILQTNITPTRGISKTDNTDPNNKRNI